MPHHPKAQTWGPFTNKRFVRRWIARWPLTAVWILAFAVPAISQDVGSEEKEFFGNGAVITATVHQGFGESIAGAATVKLYRDGSIPSGQSETSRGSAQFVVTSLGEFTVVVSAPGYAEAQKEISVRVPGRAQVDVSLRRLATPGTTAGVPGGAVLAPKAKEALDKGLLALSAERTGDAEKYVSEAVRLAPQNPDVLYAQGLLRMKQQHWAEAQTAFEKATQVDPRHARAFAALGMTFCDQGKYDAAIAPLEKSLELDSGGAWETHWALAKAYYQQQRYDDALKGSQEALAGSNGKAPEVGLLVAQSLTAVGRYEDAAQVLRELVRDHGDRREATTARRWLEKLATSGKIHSN